MSLYENSVCPVCGKKFEADDDVVTCPECGTPHHRECYKSIGHCFNASLHSQNYKYERNEDPVNTPTQTNTQGEYYVPGGENVQGEKPRQNANDTNTPSVLGMPNYSRIYGSEKTIDGESASDVAAAVSVNTPRFISVFKKLSETRKKINWNWSAFFFGEFYMFFRKMYKQAILFMCINFAALMGGMACVFKFAPKYTAAVNEFANAMYQKDISQSALQSLADKAMQSADAQTAAIIIYAILGVFIVCRIIIAMFSDSFYKKSIFALIKDVSEKLSDGASFIQTPMFMSDGQDNLSQSQMKQLYLSKRGGVSFFAPVAALLVFQILIRIASSL